MHHHYTLTGQMVLGSRLEKLVPFEHCAARVECNRLGLSRKSQAKWHGSVSQSKGSVIDLAIWFDFNERV